MKKSLLFFSLFISAISFAQDCSKLFISEYVEGWSNNKSLEIYNPTSSPIDLSQYFIARYSNGNNNALVKNSVQLSGTVQPYDVYVAVLDKRDPNGTALEAPVWDSLVARADGFYSPVYNSSDAFYFNGDDAMVLGKGTLPSDPNQSVGQIPGVQIIDIFGKIGERPTNPDGGTTPAGGWSTLFPYTGGTSGTIVTNDHSMIRKATVRKGVTNGQISFFDPLLEYDTIPAVIVRLDENGDTVFAQNGNPIVDGNWNSLGYHSCACNPLKVSKVENYKFKIYPNPSAGTFNVQGTQNIASVFVYNSLGQEVDKLDVSAKTNLTFSINQKGMYLVKITDKSGGQTIEKIIVR
jgi:hypothetical protein